MDLTQARDLFERSYAAWSAGDVDVLMTLYDPACEWDNRGLPIDPHTYRGHDELQRAVNDWFANWTEFRVEIGELTQLADDAFFIVGRGEGVGRGGGVPVQLPEIFQVVTTRAGRILRVANYVSRDDALAEARTHEESG